jgi:PAS domain S-box-containing protein
MSGGSVKAPDVLALATLRLFDELSLQGVIVTDAALIVRGWNRFMEDLTGLSATEVVGRPLLEVVPDLASRGFDAHYRAALGGEPRVLSQRFHRYLVPGRAGTSEPLQSARITPLDSGGAVVGTLTAIDDVSERVASERELRSRIEAAETARAIAEDAVRVKDEFLATLSHEIRTPLNAVLGWTKILLGRQVDAAMLNRALQVIDRNATAQTRLIDDMLDMARIMSGKLRLDMQPVDLAAIAVAAIDVVAPTAAAKGITIRTDLGTEEPWLLGDADRLQQIVWNLLSNAVKFTESGGTVSVGISRRDQSLVLRIEDSGRGIDADFLPHMFERFRQADASSSRRHGGLGLGLSLVRTLTELHGGTVAASSVVGKGSVFTVVLPSRTELGETAAPAPSERGLAAALAGLRVLLVEDQQDSREIVVAALQHHGVVVEEAATSQEALAAIDRAVAANCLPDVIVSDIGLPGEDGYLLIEQISLRPPSRGGAIPLIALTAYGSPQDKRRAIAAGFRAHLTKPVEPATLAAAVAAAAGRSAGD